MKKALNRLLLVCLLFTMGTFTVYYTGKIFKDSGELSTKSMLTCLFGNDEGL